MSLSSETPSQLSAEAHLRMLISQFYAHTAGNIEKIPAATQAQRLIRTASPMPEGILGDIPPSYLPVENHPDTQKRTDHRIVAVQTIAPDQETETIRAATESFAHHYPNHSVVIGSLVLVNSVQYTKRNTATNPPISVGAGGVMTQRHFTVLRDFASFDDVQYRVYSRIVRQASPAVAPPGPIEELGSHAVCLNDDLIPVNHYIVDALVAANSKDIQALTPESFQ